MTPQCRRSVILWCRAFICMRQHTLANPVAPPLSLQVFGRAQLHLPDLAARVNQLLGPARPIVLELNAKASEGVSQSIYDVDADLVRVSASIVDPFFASPLWPLFPFLKCSHCCSWLRLIPVGRYRNEHSSEHVLALERDATQAQGAGRGGGCDEVS